MRKLILLISCLMCLSSVAQKIAVLSDIHVSPGNENAAKLRLAVDEINKEDFDIVVVDGDLTNEGSNHELTYVKAILDGIRHPLYVIPGNHENNWSQSATKTFNDLWGNDRFVGEVGDIAIVGINCGPYMKMGDGHVKQEDIYWLEQKLDSLSALGKKIISFNHYPIRKDDLDNYREYITLLERYPIIVHINGHYHKWNKYEAGDIDAVMVRALTVDGTYGYSIISVEGDDLTVFEKLLGQDATPKYEIAIRTTHKPTVFDDMQLSESPAGFDIKCVYADSASVFTRLAFDDKCVFFGNSLGEAKAVDKATGQVVWSVPVGKASLFSRPVALPGGKVSYPNSDGIVILDANDGFKLYDIKTLSVPYVADGLLVGDTMYIQGGYKCIERRNPVTGKLVWRYDSINNYCQAAPVVDGNDLIFGAWDTYLRCLDVNTGELKWKWSNGKTANLLSPGNVVPVVTEDKVIIVAPDRYMTAIDRATGQTIWRDKSHKYRESLGHSEDMTKVYAKTMDGELVAVDAVGDTFNELWLCDMGIGYEHAPCVVVERDGVVYAGSRRGILTAVSADTHEVIWQVTLGSGEINGIDVDTSDGSVWVSLIGGEIYKISHKS